MTERYLCIGGGFDGYWFPIDYAVKHNQPVQLLKPARRSHLPLWPEDTPQVLPILNVERESYVGMAFRIGSYDRMVLRHSGLPEWKVLEKLMRGYLRPKDGEQE